MPRYFLHIDTGAERIDDEEGSELPDLGAARDEALLAARQQWAAAILAQQDLSAHRFLVTNGSGETVLTVPFIEALPPNLR
jgi:hypothetical protein